MWKTTAKLPRMSSATMLQWGHIVVDVEDLSMTHAKPSKFCASMGPHRGRCGRRCNPGLFAGDELASMGPHRGRCGRRRSVFWEVWGWMASMGPHRGRCGRPGCSSAASSRYRCFNGATSWSMWKTRNRSPRYAGLTVLQWGHIVVDVEDSVCPLGYTGFRNELQWGHIVVDVEDRCDADRRHGNQPASMGPHRGRCGRLRWQPPVTLRHQCFNGATSWSMWKT